MEAEDFAGAVEIYRVCIKRLPTSHVGYSGLVMALAQREAYTEAVRVYQDSLLRSNNTWPEEAKRQLRYNAACAAVRASTGAGQILRLEDPPVFRKQALESALG